MPRAIISSGHTKQDPGSKANGIVEYELARDIAKEVVEQLRQQGIITLIVPADLDLLKRIDWINGTNYEESNNDIAIEIHINEGGKSGIETWFEGEGESKSKQLAEAILESTSHETGLAKQGAKSEYDHEIGSIAFLHDIHMVTTLVECGYIDNEDDVKFLKEEGNIKKLAKGIVLGILKYFNIGYKESSTTNKFIPTTPQTATPSTTGTYPTIHNMPSQPQTYNHNYTNPSPAVGIPPSSPKPAGFMSREDRKKMINDLYVKILGREPNQNDLNYFLNMGINEQDLITKMINSQEHVDLVKSRQEVIKAKEELNNSKTELITLRTSTEDQRVIINNLHTLIAQKNQALAQMQQTLQLQNAHLQNTSQVPQVNTRSTEYKYKGTFLDKLFKAFSDLFE